MTLQALAVVFKGKVSHHKVHVPAKGNIQLNDKASQTNDITELIVYLQTKRKELKWQVLQL